MCREEEQTNTNKSVPFLFAGFVNSSTYDSQGPSFAVEPSNRIEFTNRGGYIVDCIVSGNPKPNIEWLDQDNSPITTIPKVNIEHHMKYAWSTDGNGAFYIWLGFFVGNFNEIGKLLET